ncbi:MAG: ATPase, partial [Pedobacter sp.]
IHVKEHFNKELDKAITDLIVTDMLVDRIVGDKIWLLTTEGVYIAQNNSLTRVLPQIKVRCMSIEQDHKGNTWIGTNQGAYYVTPERVVHFTAKNGFTDNVVNEIFRDIENNIWLGTDGSGIYKFNDNYVTFDETQGLSSKIVMTIAKGPQTGEIWMGSYNGISVYKNKAVSGVTIPSMNEISSHINFLYTDHNKHIWIGTPGGGLWKYNGTRIEQMDKGYRAIAYNAIIEDSSNNIWLSTNFGCFRYTYSSRKLTQITSQFGGGLLEMGRDSIILGSQNGAYLLTGQKDVRRMDIKGVNGSSILCMLKVREHIIFGTADYGLFIWDSKTGTIRNISSRTGLVSDHIYSLLLDSRGVIWVGTGRGINKLNSTDFNVIKNTNENDLLVECNQNAILETEGKIWIGTTKGALVYRVNPVKASNIKPFIYISSVQAHADTYKGKALSRKVVLPFKNNGVTVNYAGIYLSNPAAVMYRYRLIGLDSAYSEPSSNSSMTFTSIPPGKYTFQVNAVTKHGLTSANTASFTFEILPPYYQTTLFKIAMVFLTIILIILTVYIILTLNERKRKFRLRIKLEEQFKIRKQTAEDFHDDLGNKLTRITVLSEVLSSMINKDDTEKRAILSKINKNVDELYIGTRDILWSLNPKNDTLSQVLDRIKDFGNEMFNETSITFKVDIDIDGKDTKLSLDMSRNILMIFKESIHNALKHANASNVTFSARLNDGMLLISLQDDGPGFDTEYAKNGHGVNNMYVRAKRIKADLNITSGASGTAVCLIVNFSTLKHFKNV